MCHISQDHHPAVSPTIKPAQREMANIPSLLPAPVLAATSQNNTHSRDQCSDDLESSSQLKSWRGTTQANFLPTNLGAVLGRRKEGRGRGVSYFSLNINLKDTKL